MATFQKKYETVIRPALQKELGIANVHAVPKLVKIVVNVGTGKNMRDAAQQEKVVATVQRITGQKAAMAKAKTSISNFKLREGSVVGVRVTLRGKKMYDFIEKLINVTFPRVRDFQGISNKIFDGQGNANIGFPDYLAFPEISSDEVEALHGLQVTIVTTAKDNVAAAVLLKHFGFPFKKNPKA